MQQRQPWLGHGPWGISVRFPCLCRTLHATSLVGFTVASYSPASTCDVRLSATGRHRTRTSIGVHFAAPIGTCGVVCHEYLFNAHTPRSTTVRKVQRDRSRACLSVRAGGPRTGTQPRWLIGAQDTLDGACLGSCGVGCGSPLWPPCFAHDLCVLHYSQALIARNASRLVHGFSGFRHSRPDPWRFIRHGGCGISEGTGHRRAVLQLALGSRLQL